MTDWHGVATLPLMKRHVFQFANFVLDPATRELRRDGVRITVSPMLFDGLVWLIERRDRAVGRDELMAGVWGKADVSDAQLAQLVRKMRRLLSDDGESQGMILTIPRFGYRWVRDTSLVPVSFENTPPEPLVVIVEAPSIAVEPISAARESGADSMTPHRLWRWLALATVLIVLVLPAAFFLYLRADDENPGSSSTIAVAPAPPVSDAVVVAVLPVEISDSVGPEWTWLRLGLMDLMAHRLRQAGLFVLPSDNVVALTRDGRGAAIDHRLREAADARRVLAAQAERTGEGWVVRAQWRDDQGVARELEAHGRDPTSAARQLGDRLLGWLGQPLPRDDDADGVPDLWLQRVDAAILDADFVEARRLLETAPRALRSSPLLLVRQGDVEAATDRVDAAAQSYKAALDALQNPASDAGVRASALIGYGGALAQQGDIPAAIGKLDEAVSVLRDSAAPALLGEALYGRAVLNMVQGRLDEADADFSQARVAFELASDSLRLARLEAQQGTLLALRQRHAEALTMIEHALARFERFGIASHVVDTLGSAAIEQLTLLKPRSALATIDKTSAWMPMLDHPITRAIHDYTHARVLIATGAFTEAAALLDRSSDSSSGMQVAGLSAFLRAEVAHLKLMQENAAGAAELLTQAMPDLLAKDLDSPMYGRLRATAWLDLVRALAGSGQSMQAQAEQQRFSAAGGSDPVMRLLAGLAQVEEHWREGRRGEAIRGYEELLREANRLGTPSDIAAIAISYGDVLLEVGELARATTVIGQVARWADEDFQCAVMQVRLYRALDQHEAFGKALGQARALAGERSLSEFAPKAGPPIPRVKNK